MIIIRRYLLLVCVIIIVTVLSFFIGAGVATGFLNHFLAGLVFLIFNITIIILNGRYLKVYIQRFYLKKMKFYEIIKLIVIFLILSYSSVLIIFLTSSMIDFFQNKSGCPLCP